MKSQTNGFVIGVLLDLSVTKPTVFMGSNHSVFRMVFNIVPRFNKVHSSRALCGEIFCSEDDCTFIHTDATQTL